LLGYAVGAERKTRAEIAGDAALTARLLVDEYRGEVARQGKAVLRARRGVQ
jgi:hypothetical protein